MIRRLLLFIFLMAGFQAKAATSPVSVRTDLNAGAVIPTITVSGTLSSESSTYGTASATDFFYVSGSSLTAGITLSAPSGYELSTSANGSYSTSKLVGSAGTVVSTKIYIRLAALTPASTTAYTGTVTLTSPGAITVNSASISGLVSPFPLNLILTDKSKNYGVVLTTYTGTGYVPTGINGEVITTATVTQDAVGGSATAPVGTAYHETLSAAAGTGTFLLSNYAINYIGYTGSVLPEPVIVGANNETKVYGTSLTSGTGSIDFNTQGLQNGETIGSVTLAYTAGNSLNSGVNTYTNAVSVSAVTGGTYNPSNYSVTYQTANLVVTPAPLLITANGGSKVYGTVLTGIAGSVNFVTTGLMNGESVGSVSLTYGTGAAGASPVGTYPASVIPSTATGGTFNPANYSITYAGGPLQVNPKTVTITATPLVKNYGTLLTAGSGFSNFTAPAMANGETIGSLSMNFGPGANQTDPVGNYASSATPTNATGGNFTAANYAFTYVPGDILVNAAPLTITPVPVTKAYGATLIGGPGQTAFIISALKNGESVSTVTLQFGTGSTATDGVNAYISGVSASNATGSGFVATNYTITYVASTITVVPAAVTVTASVTAKFYGVALPASFSSASFTASTLQNGETIGTVTISPGNGSAATDPAGMYANSLTPSAATGGSYNPANYTVTYITGPLQVSPEPVTIAATTAAKIYGTVLSSGSGFTSFTATGMANGETIGYVNMSFGSGANQTDPAGDYAGSAIPTNTSGGNFSATNYSFTYVSGDILVSAALLTITPVAVSKTYGSILTGGPGQTAFTTSALQNGESISTVTLQFGTGSAATDAVNTYPGTITPGDATGSGFDATNYTITYSPATITVIPAAVTITASSTAKVYGAALPASFSSSSFTSSTLQNGELIGIVTLSAAAGSAATDPAGMYGSSVTPSAATGGTFNAANYTLTYLPGPLIVMTRSLTITCAGYAKTYGSQLSLLTGSVSFTATGLANGETAGSVSLSFGSGSAGTDPVGVYPGSVSPSGVSGGNFVATNYSINYNPGNLTVTAAALVITANPVTKIYGTALMGSSGQTGFTSTAFQNGESAGTVTMSYGPGSALTDRAATYSFSVIASELTGGSFSAANYTVTYQAADLTVIPANATITPQSRTKIYGVSLVGSSSSASFTASGLLNGDVIGTVTLTGGPGSASTDPVGIYTSTSIAGAPAGGTFLAGNYTFTYGAATLTVTPATLTINPVSASKIYGTTLAASPGITLFSATGLQNSETIGSITTVYGTGAAAIAPVGIYPAQTIAAFATGGSFTPGNYTIRYNSADILVDQAPLTITATGPQKTYGIGLLPLVGTSFTSSALVNQEAVSTVLLTPDVAGAAPNTPAGAMYSVSPSAAAAGSGTFLAANYLITYLPFTGIVSKSSLVISAQGKGKTYGTTLAASSSGTGFSVMPLPAGEGITRVTLKIDAIGQSPQSPAGTNYLITPSAAIGNTAFNTANYTISYLPATVQVLPAPLTISASQAGKVYGVLLPNSSGSVLFTSSGLQNMETIGSVNLNYLTGGLPADPAGNYPGSVAVSAATGGNFLAANYTINYLPALLTVTAAPLVISGGNMTKVYGTSVAAGNGFTDFTATGLQNNETIGSVSKSPSPGAESSAAVGVYSGSVSSSAATGGSFTPANYQLSYLPGTLTVTPALLTVTAADMIKTYGSQLVNASFQAVILAPTSASPGFTVTGLQNGEVAGSLFISYGTGALPASAVGIYAGSVGGSQLTGGTFNPGNYLISYACGAITVRPAALTVTVSGLNKPYGISLNEDPASTAFSLTGLQNRETTGTVILAFGTGGVASAPAGTYPGNITGSGLSGGSFIPGNYQITYLPATLIVGTPAPVVTILSQPDCAMPTGSFTIQNYAPGTVYTVSGAASLSQSGTVFTAIPGTYTLTALAPASFTSPVSLTFKINTQPPVPNLIITNPAEKYAPAVINLTAPAITAQNDPGLVFSYYSDAAGLITLTDPQAITRSGVYYIRAKNASGCLSLVKAVYVYLDPLPVLIITNPGPVTVRTVADLTAHTVTAGSTPGLIYTYFNDALATSPLSDPAAMPTAGTYYIKGTDAGGNSVIKPVVISITNSIFIPNIFTPNGDGRNDRFVIPGLQFFPGSSLVIYNQWGTVLYQNPDYRNTWDGGNQRPGTYYYILNLKKGEGNTVYKGWVQILH